MLRSASSLKNDNDHMRFEMHLVLHMVTLSIKDKLDGLAPVCGCAISRRTLRNRLFAFLKKLSSNYGSGPYRTAASATRRLPSLKKVVDEFISTLEEPIKTLVRLQNLEKRQLGFSKRICLARQGALFTDSQKLFNKTNRRSTIARPRPPSTPRAKKRRRNQ